MRTSERFTFASSDFSTDTVNTDTDGVTPTTLRLDACMLDSPCSLMPFRLRLKVTPTQISQCARPSPASFFALAEETSRYDKRGRIYGVEA